MPLFHISFPYYDYNCLIYLFIYIYFFIYRRKETAYAFYL